MALVAPAGCSEPKKAEAPLARKGHGPDPAKAQQLGNKYLEEKFPKLDGIRKAILLQ